MIIDKQIELFVTSLYIGLLLGILYSILKILLGKNTIIKIISDIVFFISYALYAVMLYDRVYFGVFRLYFYFLIGIGYLVYIKFLKREFEVNFNRFCRGIRNIIKYLVEKLEYWLFPPIFRYIYRKLLFIKNKIALLFEKKKNI